MVLSPLQPLEPPLLSGNTHCDVFFLNRRMTAQSNGNPIRRESSHSPGRMLPEPGIQLPAIRSMFSFPPHRDYGTLRMNTQPERAPKAGSTVSSGQDLRNSPFLSESRVSARPADAAMEEPAFAKLLTAGCGMKTILEAMDQELSPEDVLGLFHVNLARPP